MKYIKSTIRKAKQYHLDIAIVALFFFYACFMTWPFAIQPTTTLTAPLAGDTSNSVTKFDSIKQEGANPFTDGHLSTIAAPEGITTNTNVDRISLFSTLFLWSVTLATSSVVAHGLFTFLGYFLTATILYFFIKSVFRSRYIGFVSGFAYASFPLFVSLARAAPIYNHMWLYILPIWTFFILWKRPSRLNLAITTLSILPALLWTPYFALHILIIGFSLLGTYLIYTHKSLGLKKTFNSLALIAGSWILLVGLYYLLGSSSGNGGAPVRTIEEAYQQSIHPLMLILPGAFSWWGQSGYQFLHSVIPRAYETNLYLGVSTLLLALAGLYCFINKKLRNSLPPSIQIVGFFGLSIAAVSLLFSLAPTIHVMGLDVPTLNSVVVGIMPALRAGQRLAAPIMLGTIILAAVATYTLLRQISSKKIKITIATFLAVVLFIDLSSRPPLMTTQLPQSSASSQLSLAESGLVAQYMNGSITGDPGQLPCQLRLLHRQTLFNFCGLEIDYPAGQLQPIHKLALLPLSQQFTDLKRAGVKYIIFDRTDKSTIRVLQTGNYGARQTLIDNRFIIFELN